MVSCIFSIFASSPPKVCPLSSGFEHLSDSEEVGCELPDFEFVVSSRSRALQTLKCLEEKFSIVHFLDSYLILRGFVVVWIADEIEGFAFVKIFSPRLKIARRQTTGNSTILSFKVLYSSSVAWS